MALLLHFLLFSVLLFPSRAQPSLPSAGIADDLRSLLEFKKGIRHDPSGLVLASWNWDQTSALGSSGCPGDWHGVACDANGGVVALALNGLGLSGNLKFSTLSGMRTLRNLTLSSNNFTGRITPALGSMASLQHLDLSGNQFYGPVPGRIADLWGLVHLNLSFNGFTGGFPSGVRNLQQLRVLDLRSNGLWGDVGALLSELRNVEHLDLSDNAFYGGLRMDSTNLSSFANTAKLVNLSRNKLNGGFFASESLGLFQNLEILDVGENQLSGELPSFQSLSNLRFLRARKNQLYGSLPQELFGSSMALVVLDLSGNGLTGPVFNINSTSLKILNLSSNALSGSLPSDIGSCHTVDLSGNIISGDLSSLQSWGATLEVVDLSSNVLSGNLPNLTSHFETLTSFKMRNNSLLGLLPSMLGSHPRLATLDLSMNKLTGPLLPSFFTSLTLKYLNLSGNHFGGTIPLQSPRSPESLVLPSISHMEFLDLSDNSLSGTLPSEIVEMQKLKVLNLGKNSFYGELPSEIGKLDSLEVFDLSMNNFKGKIPDMPQLNLMAFNISYNDLSGLVPENLRKFHDDSFHPGNILLVLPDGMSASNGGSGFINNGAQHHYSKSRIRVAIVVGSIGAVVLIFFIFMAVYRIKTQAFCGGNGFRVYASGKDITFRRFVLPSIFRSHNNNGIPSSVSFHNNHLFRSAVPAQKDSESETFESGVSDSRELGSESLNHGVQEHCVPTSEFTSSPGSSLASSLHFIDSHQIDQPAVLDVYSPDRLAGELFFLDNLLVFTAEDLSRAPAEVLGRSSHGTSYKATLNTGHILTVKWLRVGLVRRKKEFAKELKRIGHIIHPNIISIRGYYWGPREQERLILSDYIYGDSLALHLHGWLPNEQLQQPALRFQQQPGQHPTHLADCVAATISGDEVVSKFGRTETFGTSGRSKESNPASESESDCSWDASTEAEDIDASGSSLENTAVELLIRWLGPF
ncbi:hypothetical protein Taro_052195 [Colocasia esculenta]|uniref:Leucine-rich repeat-containing N-terminal plant-type domain-containing protein n=1 Tax=Colocasia esculenta TaxID=4460 RepID=A0A843XIM8_COLES|nr:hypothetical protein [Colocasia esculenta]